ncbi:hypothetical protein GALMADRAFT_136948 [Galerina marginata CBS 339.88]|uniref:Uncharacterized protein n=1 Tax=Galerina marginata (strain CBS 339.88) TaxID=685588 RepID=A0A067TNG1_GALM3|nr:hypothetical protein GALMADRAFT_136948 [Galerina marginata CBS 339.88]
MVKYTVLVASALIAASPALSSNIVGDNEVRSDNFDTLVTREVIDPIFGREFTDFEIEERALPATIIERSQEPLDLQLERRLVLSKPGSFKIPPGALHLGHGPVVNPGTRGPLRIPSGGLPKPFLGHGPVVNPRNRGPLNIPGGLPKLNLGHGPVVNTRNRGQHTSRLERRRLPGARPLNLGHGPVVNNHRGPGQLLGPRPFLGHGPVVNTRNRAQHTSRIERRRLPGARPLNLGHGPVVNNHRGPGQLSGPRPFLGHGPVVNTRNRGQHTSRLERRLFPARPGGRLLSLGHGPVVNNHRGPGQLLGPRPLNRLPNLPRIPSSRYIAREIDELD